MAGLNELVKLPEGKSWAEVLAELDKDKDGRLSKDEAPEKEMARLWFLFDLDGSGFIEQRDYEIVQARQAARAT